MVISNQVFQDTIHHSNNKRTTKENAASLIRVDIRNQCTVNPDETSWPPNLSELQDLPVPHSVRLFFQTLLATEKHGSATNEKSARLIDSFSADLISSVTNGSVLAAKHYLLAVGLHSITGMKQISRFLTKWVTACLISKHVRSRLQWQKVHLFEQNDQTFCHCCPWVMRLC